MEWLFYPVDDRRLIRNRFDCGIPELNEYLKKYARQNHQKGIASTWVAVSKDETWQVAGYYSLSMAEIKRESLPTADRKGLPRYPLPAIRIGKLAVTRSRQGQRLGETLLVDAFNRGIRISKEIGVLGITVDSLNEQAKAFYLKYGFIPLEDNKYSLFLPMKRILKILG